MAILNDIFGADLFNEKVSKAIINTGQIIYEWKDLEARSLDELHELYEEAQDQLHYQERALTQRAVSQMWSCLITLVLEEVLAN